MKRLSAVLMSLCLMVACMLPVSASYEWHGQSFMDDYLGNTSEASSPVDIPVSSELVPVPQSDLVGSPVPYAAQGDGSLGTISGNDFGSHLSLSPDTCSGGVFVYDEIESYKIQTGGWGTSKPTYTTLGGYTLPLMAPSSFPALSFTTSGASASVTMPSTRISTSSSDHGTLRAVYNILTGPSGFSGPGSNALQYIDFSFDITGLADGVTDIEFNGSLHIGTSITLDSGTSSTVGGAFNIIVNGALTELGTADSAGNIQFNNYLFSSTEPIESVILRFNPNPPSRSVNARSSSCSWTMNLDLSALTMTFVTGGGEDFVDTSYLQAQAQAVEDMQGEYDAIRGQWSENMSNNFSALQMDTFAFDAGLLSGFYLLTGIFNDIWLAMGIYNVLFVIPLLLGIGLLVIGRVSRYSVSSKPSGGGSGLRHKGGTSAWKGG